MFYKIDFKICICQIFPLTLSKFYFTSHVTKLALNGETVIEFNSESNFASCVLHQNIFIPYFKFWTSRLAWVPIGRANCIQRFSPRCRHPFTALANIINISLHALHFLETAGVVPLRRCYVQFLFFSNFLFLQEFPKNFVL